MQTFLPYPDFIKSLKTLDYRRLGKQRVEACQIIRILQAVSQPKVNLGGGYRNHPAVKMWRGHVNALKLYYNYALDEWIDRGYNNRMEKMPIHGRIVFPKWFGNDKFHAAHRSNLLRKNPVYYGQFNWQEKPDLPYLWGQTIE
jgi:hypothetical protein